MSHVKPCPRCEGKGWLVDKRGRLSIEDKTQVRIRLAAGERGKDIAASLGVAEGTISRIKHDVGPRA